MGVLDRAVVDLGGIGQFSVQGRHARRELVTTTGNQERGAGQGVTDSLRGPSTLHADSTQVGCPLDV